MLQLTTDTLLQCLTPDTLSTLCEQVCRERDALDEQKRLVQHLTAPALAARLNAGEDKGGLIARVLAFGDGEIVVIASLAKQLLEGRVLRVLIHVAAQDGPAGRRRTEGASRRGGWGGGCRFLGARGSWETSERHDAVGLDAPRLAVETHGRVPVREILRRSFPELANLLADQVIGIIFPHDTGRDGVWVDLETGPFARKDCTREGEQSHQIRDERWREECGFHGDCNEDLQFGKGSGGRKREC